MEVLLDTRGRRRVKALLLIYLCALKAAADCPKPQVNGNIVLTNEALLMNNFPEGSDVTLDCANGYVRESGSGVTTCMDENWTKPDLMCKKKDCGPPKPQPNMSFNTSAGTLFGAVIRVACDRGYHISGSSYKQCYATGWTGRAKCEIVTCDIPSEVANGRSSWDSQENPKYRELIHYICNEGYTLVGKDNIMCSETGEYDSPPPECKGVTPEDRTTTTAMVIPSATTPAQEASTDSSAAPTANRDKSTTTSATQSVTPSAPGGRGIMSAEDKATTTSVTSVYQDKHNGDADTSKDIGYMPVIVSVISVLLVVSVVVFFLHRFLMRRKGSVNGSRPIC